MARVYQVITGNWLHRSKRIFESIEESIGHIKKIVDMKADWVSHSQALMSYHITTIDTDELPEYRKIFKEHAEIRPPDAPRKKPLPKLPGVGNLFKDKPTAPKSPRPESVCTTLSSTEEI